MSTPPRYRLLSSLGKGGMGEVWLADDAQLGRKVAIKFLAEALEHDAAARERLQREARSAAALDHPYVCKVYEIAEVDGRTGIVMEHVDGETLQALLARGPLSPRRALAIAGEIAEGLDAAHARRLVHRDLKPANVMLTDGHVKVMDFGLAKAAANHATPGPEAETMHAITGSGVRVGTPGYMAPEQILGSEADTRSDIFAFGILLYELLAGLHPFQRTSQSGTMTAILQDAPPPVTQYQTALPRSAVAILERLLAKQPDQRHQSLADVRNDLTSLLESVSSVTPAAGTPVSSTLDETPGSERSPYVGRETERAEARRLLEQAVAGRGVTLLLGGEPGVGKTRFTEELIREARERGCLTLVGHCYETEGHPPFMPFVEMLEHSSKIVERSALRQALGEAAPEVAKIAPELRRVFPDIPQAIELPPEQQRRYLFNAYQAFTERAARAMPMVVVLEDLHWADEPTVLLMQHLAQHLTPLPLLMVGTYRDVELDVGRPWAKVLESLVRERLATRIALRRLPEEDIAALLEALGGPDPPAALARTVYRETEGNPFFVEEVFQHLKEEGRLFDAEGRWRTDLDTGELQVPEGVRLVIGRRLERVSDDVRKALTVAAVVGRNFDLGVLEAASGIDGDTLLDALEEAERAQLVTSTASRREIRYTFSHELIRQTLQQNLSLPRRQRLHLRVAEALETTGGEAGAPAAALAHHCYQAGSLADAETTLRYLSTAGQQALTAAAFEEAVRHFTNALSCEPLTPPTRAGLLCDRATALRSVAQADDAIVDWQDALTIYEELEDATGLGQVAWDLSYLLTWQNRLEDARTALERAIRLVPDDGTPRAQVLARLGSCQIFLGNAAGGVKLLLEAGAIAKTLGDQRLLGQVLTIQGTMLTQITRVDTALEVLPEAVRALRSTDDPWTLALALGVTGFGLMTAGRVREALPLSSEAERLASAVGYDGAAATASANLCEIEMTRGNLAAAETLMRQATDVFQRAGALSANAQVMLSVINHGRGAEDEARVLADTAVSLPVAEWAREFSRGWRRLLRAHDGDSGWLDEHRSDQTRLFAEDRIPFMGDIGAACFSTEALALVGARQDAHRLYRPVLTARNQGMVCTPMVGLTEAALGIAAACGADWDTAVTHFEAALQQATDMPHRIAEPEVRRWYAWMLLDRGAPGDRDKARTLLGEAIEMYRSIGMPKHKRMADDMLATIT